MDESKREAAFFDSLTDAHGEFNPFERRGWTTLRRQFEKMIRRDGPVDLLDVGCGTGQSRQIYIDSVGRYLGADLSYQSVRRARSQFPGNLWMVADAGVLPMVDDSLDVVAFSSVLHHVPDYRRPLIEAMRVLKGGGQVFAFDPNLLHPAMALFRHPRSPLYRPAGVSPNERPLLPRALRKAFALAGFVEIQQHGQANIPYRAVAPRLLNAMLALYNAGDWLMEMVGLGRWFGSFVITAGRKPLLAAAKQRE
jgi:SAM-dependent methyltransferase